jgi:hypothetical protein
MAAPATMIMNRLTATEEKVLDALVGVQEPVVDYVRKAVEYVESAVPALPTKDMAENLPTVKQVVDTQFAFAAKVIDNQHRFVSDLLEATKPVAEKVVSQKPAPGVRKVTKTAKSTAKRAAA